MKRSPAVEAMILGRARMRRRKGRFSAREVRLALRWIRGEVSHVQIMRSANRSTSTTYLLLATRLKRAYELGLLRNGAAK